MTSFGLGFVFAALAGLLACLPSWHYAIFPALISLGWFTESAAEVIANRIALASVVFFNSLEDRKADKGAKAEVK
jgi:hypothetical protein